MLDALFIEGAVVTIDVMSMQKEIAQKIIAGKGDYLLAIKENLEYLDGDIKEAFKEGKVDDAYVPELEIGHGLIEHRTTKVIPDLDLI